MSVTPQTLRQLLRYDADTGKLFWLARDVSLFHDGLFTAEKACAAWNGRFAGKEAFTAISSRGGYRVGSIFRRLYPAHRVIWAIAFGGWPADQIDHINGNVSDNRIENLRVVSNQENARNAKRPIRNTSGVTGVGWKKRDSVWCSYITVNKRRFHLGHFPNFSDAVAARMAAEVEYGFHANHGRASLDGRENA